MNLYDSRLDYKKIRIRYENEIINRIEKINKALSDEKKPNSDIYKIVEKHLSVIDDYKIDFIQTLISNEKYYYLIKHVDQFSLGFGKRTKINSQSENIISRNKYDPEGIIIGSREFVRTYSLELSYKWLLKQDIRAFSYIDISVFYTFVDSKSTIDIEDKYVRKTVSDQGNIKTYNFFDYGDFGYSDNVYNYGLSFSTPFFAITPNIICEFGINANMQKSTYKIDQTYNYKKIKSYYNDEGYFERSEILKEIDNISETYVDSEQILKILPMFSIQYNNILDNLELRLTYIFNSIYYNEIYAGVRVTF